MKITNSNKTKQTITITGDAAEMVLLLNLAEKMSEIKLNNASGLERETYNEMFEECSELGQSISNGDHFC